MQDFEIHAVNKDTKNNVFPYQGPNQNICGTACLISAILITDFDIRHRLCLRNKLPKQLVWLRMLYNYDDFARYLFIKWYMETFMVWLFLVLLLNFLIVECMLKFWEVGCFR